MEQAILTTESLNTDPRHCRLALQVCTDAIEAVVSPLVPAEEGWLSTRIPYAAGQDAATALQEAVYANPLLVAPFGRVDVLVRTRRQMPVPSDCSHSEGIDADIVSLAGWTDDDGRPRDCFLSSAGRLYALVAQADRGMLRFLRRTYDTARIMHPLAVLNRWFESRSVLGNFGKVYINLRRDCTDFFVYNSLGPAAITSLQSVEAPDCVYYSLALCHASGLATSDVEVHLAGDPGRRAGLASMLRNFFPTVVPAVFPSSLLAHGASAMAAPLELTVLPLCE